MRGVGPIGDLIWRWGLPAIAIVALLLAVVHGLAIFGFLGVKPVSNLTDDIIKYLAISLTALALLRAGNLLKLKLPGGVGFEFGNVVDQSNKQVADIQQLQNSVLELRKKIYLIEPLDQIPPAAETAYEEMPPLPPIKWINDRNKDRFGGARVRDGYEISATFLYRNIDDPVVKVRLAVKKDGSPVERNVKFFLHESFGERQEITVVADDGKISLEILAAGGFTVGAWIMGTTTLLELDLATEPSAPTVIRNL